jgi:hypothetical protein
MRKIAILLSLLSLACACVFIARAQNVTSPPVAVVKYFTFCASGCTITGTPCTTAASANATCTNTINWPASFPDSNYSAQCTGVGNSGFAYLANLSPSPKSTTTITVVTSNGQGSAAVAANFTEIDCSGSHN